MVAEIGKVHHAKLKTSMFFQISYSFMPQAQAEKGSEVRRGSLSSYLSPVGHYPKSLKSQNKSNKETYTFKLPLRLFSINVN